METTTRSVLCFGKLPIHGDFVRFGASRAGVQAIDAWFQKGLFVARERVPEKFDDAYDASPVFSFVFSPPDAAEALVGAMQPSRDRSGRRYPFLVAFEVDVSLLEPRSVALLPVQFGGFYAWASQLVREATAGRIAYGDLPQLLKAFDGTSASSDADGYEQYLRQTTFKTFVERIWGDFSDARKYLLVKNLIDITQPIRGHVPPHFQLGLRFPLVRELSERTFAASFWLEVSVRLLQVSRIAPTFLWTSSEASGESDPFLLLYLLSPLGQAFEDLLSLPTDRDHLCTLDEMGAESTAHLARSLPQRRTPLLDAEQISLWDFQEQF